MKYRSVRSAALLVAAALLVTGSASALFGLGKAKEAAPEGAPIVPDLEIRTYRGVPYEGKFSVSAGDGVTFTVVELPKKGSVSVDGDSFVYTPKDNASGTDRFTYAAADADGRASAPAAVTVTIEKTRSGVTYGDTDPAVATAAQAMAEAGIFVGEKIGDRYYFDADRSVSRSEFLAMALEAADRKVTPVTMTPFCDDETIPVWAKAYVSAGVADGIVEGRATPEGMAFGGDRAITLNEAATILDRMLSAGNVDLAAWFADREAAPSWAAQAVGNMEALNVVAAGSFGSGAMAQPITRGDAANMITSAAALLTGSEKGRTLQELLR